MVNALRWIWFLGLLIAFGIGWTALSNWMFGKHDPLWLGPIWMLVLSAGVGVLNWCQRRGWIKGVLWNRPKELEERQRSLAADRERIIAEAAAKRPHR
jgi:hypothetical protein